MPHPIAISVAKKAAIGGISKKNSVKIKPIPKEIDFNFVIIDISKLFPSNS